MRITGSATLPSGSSVPIGEEVLSVHLAAAVEFHDPDRVNPAARLEENLLFGRISASEANAEPRVRTLVRRVLADEGLEATVYRLGLDSRIDPQGGGSTMADIGRRERVAIDLARCLAREPDILVVATLMDEKAGDLRERLMRLRQARAGRGLIVCLPQTAVPEGLDPFDATVAVENSAVVVPAPALPAETGAEPALMA